MRPRILVTSLLLAIVFSACQSGSVVDVDSSLFSAPPEVVVLEDRILVRVFDSGRGFNAVERPLVSFRDGNIMLMVKGFVQSAGGPRSYTYDLPKSYQKKDLTDKVFWINSNGKPVPVKVIHRKQ